MTVTDEIEFDDDEIVADSDPLDRAGRPGPRDVAARLLARWKSWPLWMRVVSIPVGGWVAIVVLSFVLGTLASILGVGGGDDPAAPVAPTATTLPADTTDALVGLPSVSPIVAAVVKPADRAEFRNKINTVTADGTSICDIYFGVVLEQQQDGSMRSRWSVTTPGMQQRSGEGVHLPSSQWPVRAFYGDQNVCNVAGQDVPLTTLDALGLPPTTVASTVTTLSPGE